MDTTRRKRCTTLVVTLGLLPAAVAVAADQPVVQTAEEMVVTASRTEERPIDLPMDTQVIGRETIEQSGATTVGELLGTHVTGHLQKYSGMNTAVGLRGFRTEAHGEDIAGHVLLLIDGHRAGTGNAAKINLDRIERVEVIKGPSSALYGSAAMGGVVNLITKKGDGPLGGSIGGEYGSFDYYKGLLSAGGEVNERFRFHATTSTEGIDDYDDPTFGTVYNSGEEKTNVGGNFVYTFSDRHELRLGGNYADLMGEYPDWQDLDGDFNPNPYTAYRRDFAPDTDKSNGYTDLEYNGDFFAGRVHWKGLVYYLYDKNQYNYGQIDKDADRSKQVDESLGTDHQVSWRTSDWNTLLTGFTLESMERESSAWMEYAPQTPYSPGLDYDNQAVFVQDSLDLLDNRVNLIAAARYDRFEMSTEQGETGEYEGFRGRSESYDHVSPKLGASVKFFDEMLRVRANIGEGFRSPTADQLAADYRHWGTRYVGNPDLDPETSQTYDLGFDLFRGPLTFKAGYFHTDFEDKIMRQSFLDSGVETVSFTNGGDAEIDGFEFGLEWDAAATLELPFGASFWSNMTVNTTMEDEETGEDLTYISDYELKSGLNLSHGDLGAQLTHVLVGPQQVDNYDRYPYTTSELGSFNYWDLTLRCKIAGSWEVKASVLNLFDQEVEWVRGYLMPERNYRIGLTYTF